MAHLHEAETCVSACTLLLYSGQAEAVITVKLLRLQVHCIHGRIRRYQRDSTHSPASAAYAKACGISIIAVTIPADASATNASLFMDAKTVMNVILGSNAGKEAAADEARCNNDGCGVLDSVQTSFVTEFGAMTTIWAAQMNRW